MKTLWTFLLLMGWLGQAEVRPETLSYSKTVVDIPMRDGIHLHTHIYSPDNVPGPFAFMINRTPYSIMPYEDAKKTQLGPSSRFKEHGFIFVYQDVRGRFMSEGEFVNMTPHSQNGVNQNTDTYDTLEWLLNNIPNHNGKAGVWGISYPGFFTSTAIIDSHPALVAASPQAPIADWFWDDVHHNGAFSLQLAFTFLYSFGQEREGLTTRWPAPFEFPTMDKYAFFKDLGPLSNVNSKHFHGEIPFWNDIIAHPNYDSFWQARNILPHLKGVTSNVLTVGGWFDAEDLYGVLKTYQAIESQNPNTINHLVMGPWSHGAWARGSGSRLGDADFGSPTSEFYREHIEFPFFLHHLYGKPNPSLPEAMIFETGRNKWRQFNQWPPQQLKHGVLALKTTGDLDLQMEAQPEKPLSSGTTAPSDNKSTIDPAPFVSFVSNPKDPVPYSEEMESRWGRRFMAEDQRFLHGRKDVLSFQTPPLEQDITIAGPLMARLFVATNRTAADWVVKLIDVHPEDGKELMVRWEMFRGRFRESFEKPKPFEKDAITEIEIPLLDTLHTFRKGHRIMIQVQSSFFPFFDMNPQTYVDNIFEARRRHFKKANHRVYTGGEKASRIEFTSLPEHALRVWNPTAHHSEKSPSEKSPTHKP